MARRLDTGAFDREIRALLAAARWSAADLEQVLESTARIDLGDGDSWLREWTAAGGAQWVQARQGDKSDAYLHAASYYGAALALIDTSDGLVDEAALWARQRECWNRAVAQLGGELLPIPYDGTTLPGFFFSAGEGRRPVVVIDPGGRMVTSAALAQVGAAANVRGYHWLTFDGPGRQAALHVQQLVLRPDWEAVLEPVTTALLQRRDVDRSRMAIVGLEHGAFGIVTALRAERRFSAAMLAPGILDAGRPWIAALPQEAQEALLDGDADLFERELHLASLFAPGIHHDLRRRGAWYGGPELSLYELYRRIQGYRLDDGLLKVQAHTSVCEPLEGCCCWEGESAALAERLEPTGTLVRGRRTTDAIEGWLDSLF